MSVIPLQRLTAALATVPLILPATTSSVQAADRSPSASAIATQAPVSLRPTDIQLTPENILAGQVVDVRGAVIRNAEIVVTQGHREIARTTANEAGEFSVSIPRGGIYLVTSGDSLQLVRLWTSAAAPPHSRNRLRLAPPIVVRGQNADGTVLGMSNGTATVVGLTIAAGVATAIAVPLALNSNNEHNNKSDQQELRPATP